MPSTTPDPFAPQPDPFAPQAVREAYDTVAGTYAEMIPDTRAEAPIDLAMVDSFAVAISASDDASVLDAGCGTGRMSRYLADRGCAVEGLDLSPGMVAMARRDFPDLSFGVGSLTELPFADGRFAGVLFWYSTIHTLPEGQPAIFAEAARVLRPGGHVLVGFQSGEGVREVASYRRFGHDVELHRNLFTADEVSAHLASAGLTEVCRMQRRAVGTEREGQSVVLASAD